MPKREIYLIERFDRLSPGNRLERPTFAAGLTTLGAHQSEVSRYSHADLAAVLRQHGIKVRRDLHERFRRMVFNILVTNSDDHLRNHGSRFGGKGWQLSPLFDDRATPQVGLERRPVLGVGPQGRNATIGNALAGATALDLPLNRRPL